MTRIIFLLYFFQLLFIFTFFSSTAQEALSLNVTDAVVRLEFPIMAHVNEFQVTATTNLLTPFLPKPATGIFGFSFSEVLDGSLQFYRLQATPVSSNELVTAIALNRLAYGPTPDELARVRSIGPQAFIEEQLAPEKITEDSALNTFQPLTNGWEYVSVTGVAWSLPELWVWPDDGAVVYLDDLSVVRGTVAGVGANLIRNGDFETSLNPGDWIFGPNNDESRIVTTPAHSGAGALMLLSKYNDGVAKVASRCPLPGIVAGQTYTLSYWHYRQTNRPPPLLFGLFQPDQSNSKLNSTGLHSPDFALPLETKLVYGIATISDLRAWFTTRAVCARRQLFEVLMQFLENHFVTSLHKSMDFLSGHFWNGDLTIERSAVDATFRLEKRLRSALLRPDCAFYDVLKISAESSAMIYFLDTVISDGEPGAIPNENYGRELMELFTMGVDNGYDQNDVTEMARAWTGWRVLIVNPTDDPDLLAPMSTHRITEFADDNWRHYFGIFGASFGSAWHDPNEKTLFKGKSVPARFGSPYAGKQYQLILPPRLGTNGLQDGYDVLNHLANLPFTQEFISVKLCRLFVHDNFAIGYDFTSPDLSTEGRLVRECMRAWEESAPKGDIRKVLEVIYNSDLFRSQAAAFQKFKTPLEFVVSSVRALRSTAADGKFTASTDGFAFENPLERMGRMVLFDREQPDGFPEVAGPMVYAQALAERQRFVAAFLSPSGPGRISEGGGNITDPVKLLKKSLPAESWADASSVVAFFLDSIFAGHGRASLDLQRLAAIDFLNTNNLEQSSPFSALDPKESDYDERVRGMVASLIGGRLFNLQ